MMRCGRVWFLTVCTIIAAGVIAAAAPTREISRPEEIRSKREVIYDQATYAELARLWQGYYEEYPSEYAYANWMYASRYADAPNYWELLDKGLEKYPANPVLLYLKSLEKLGTPNNTESIKYLERAVALDPHYIDPWFVLVTHYMDARDDERLKLALRKLLEGGAISDEVMDFNYNVLIAMEPNGILITNGDNDTYPGWILTKLLGVRPDIRIVNRSLLNTEWYPLYVVEQGAPRFIGKDELLKLREETFAEMKEKPKKQISASGPFGDTLIQLLVDAAERAERPVYLARTLFSSPRIEALTEAGRDLGIFTLATRSDKSYATQLESVLATWVDSFRTGGLDSWRLREAPETDGGRMLVSNYAMMIAGTLGAIKENVPQLRAPLFEWYRQHVEALLKEEMKYEVARAWCCLAGDVQVVDAWCKQQGIECKDKMEE